MQSPSRVNFLLLLLLLLVPIVVAQSSGDGGCSTKEECCNSCGEDSVRCARGPCSSDFIMTHIFDVSAPTHMTFLGFLGTLYGMLPYIVPFLVLLDLLFWHRSWARVFCLLLCLAIAIVYLIIQNAVGECSICSRPCGTCLDSSGMPSGHAANAAGLTVWMILEMILGFGRRWSMSSRISAIIISLILFAPVSWGRAYVGDHVWEQLVIGTAEGIAVAVVYFIILRKCLRHRKLESASGKVERFTKGHVHIKDDYTLDGAPRDDYQLASDA